MGSREPSFILNSGSTQHSLVCLSPLQIHNNLLLGELSFIIDHKTTSSTSFLLEFIFRMSNVQQKDMEVCSFRKLKLFQYVCGLSLLFSYAEKCMHVQTLNQTLVSFKVFYQTK